MTEFEQADQTLALCCIVGRSRQQPLWEALPLLVVVCGVSSNADGLAVVVARLNQVLLLFLFVFW